MATQYSKQLKAFVVHEICELGKSTSGTAHSYGIPLKTVEKWVTLYRKDKTVFEEKQLSDSDRIKQLEAIIKKQQQHIDILKKTLSLSARDNFYIDK